MKKIIVSLLAVITLTGCGSHVHDATHVDTTEDEVEQSECFVVETYDTNFWGTTSENYATGLYCEKDPR